jgi:hypothetical protein
MLNFRRENKNFFFFDKKNRITQSRSFQMLEGWITDSEKSIAALVPPTPSSSSAGE